MSDHEIIYLEPECCADPHGDGRTWCQDDVYSGQCDDDKEPTKYIRFDLHEAALAQGPHLAKVLKLAYRHASGDTSAGTQETTAALCDALCNEIGDDAFCKFVENDVRDY